MTRIGSSSVSSPRVSAGPWGFGAVALAAALAGALALGANRPVTWTTLSLVVTVAFLGQMLADLGRGPSLPARTRIAGPAALWLAVMAWGAVQVWVPWPALAHPSWALVEGPPTISPDPATGRHHLLRLALYAMVFWLVARAAMSGHVARALVIAVAVFGAGLAAYGIGAAALGRNPITGDPAQGASVIASFLNRNSYATHAAFGMLANLGLWLRAMRQARGGRAVARAAIGSGGWLVGAALCLAALILTQSRAGSAAGLAGAAVLLAVYGRSLGGWIGAGALAAVAAAAAPGVLARIAATGAEPRLPVWQAVLDGIAARPWAGHGLGGFADGFRAEVPLAAARADWTRAHSTYLELAWELGLPAAAALLLAVLWVVLRIARGVAQRRRNRLMPSLALAAAVTAGLHAAVDFSLQVPAVATLFAALLGIGWAQAFPTDPSRRARG